MYLPVLSVAILSLFSLIHGLPSLRTTGDDQGLIIETTSGEIHGFINSTAPDVRQFLGIPYAEPPLESLRFAPPQSKSNNGSVDATVFPPSCMQQFSNGSTIYTAYETQFLINGGQSEDCLYVSVWTPSFKNIQNQQLPLPVFLYIPGGGFTSGGQNSLYKIPDKWVQRTQSHIVVVMNYRLNVFGYPNSAALNDQNVGLLDQRLAVEWTQANIAAFGGDPSRIILWGQSAGAASSDVYSYAYPQDPIVAGLIADSGSALIITNNDLNHTNFTFLASLVGCGNLQPQSELDCMRKVPAMTLENALSNYAISGQKPSIAFTPVFDNKTAFSNTTDRVRQGLVAKLPMIIGSNTNEGAGFVPFTPTGPGQNVLNATTQSVIACPVAREIHTRITSNLPTYRYQYAGNFSNISPIPWIGASHSSELPLVFGTHDEYRGASTEFEYSVSEAMEALWLSFAQDPSAVRGPRWLRPGMSGGLEEFQWPLFQTGVDSMVLFAEDGLVLQLVSGERIDATCTGL